MNNAERQLLTALRTASFNNAGTADRLGLFANRFPALARELREMAGQLEQDADTLEVFVNEIHEGRILRVP
ncbi:hypothetical protein [Pseudomonas pseudonitroreducens]|uniref:hypothetical protein n=1 Tax=Pseudomonas pseudonitroreducens TaxID=2892326 RepID=UPI001F350E71|nr:hypothetical protein [Pseudomonas pseudonitroreducens]